MCDTDFDRATADYDRRLRDWSIKFRDQINYYILHGHSSFDRLDNDVLVFDWRRKDDDDPRGVSKQGISKTLHDYVASAHTNNDQDREQRSWDWWSIDLFDGIRSGMRRLGPDGRRYPYLLGQCCFECPADAQPVAGGRDWRDVLRERYGVGIRHIRHLDAIVRPSESVRS